MKTNIYFIIVVICLFQISSIGQTNYSPNSTISKVVVYEKGAMVTRSIDVSQVSEAGTIIIDSLANNVTQKSIQVNSSGGIKIISVKSEVEIENVDLPDSFDQHYKRTLALQDSIEYLNTLQSAISQEIEVIVKNDDFKTENGVNIDQVSKASELYQSRLRELKVEQLDIKLRIRDLNNRLNKLNTEMIEMKVPSFRNHKVVVKIDKPTGTKHSMDISYFTPSATWYTFYDLRISEKVNNSSLDHKAYVSQSTGEDWENVKLTLSNRNPDKRIAPPTINPYRLQNAKHRAYQQNTSNNGEIPTIISGKVFDSSGEPLIGASVTVKGTTQGTITDIDGSFTTYTFGETEIVVSYTGYTTQVTNIRGLHFANIVLSEGQILDEIVVTGSLSRSNIGYSSRKKEIVLRKSITIKEQQSLNVNSFEIERSYTIPSDSEEYDVLLKSSPIPFEFKYLIYPSIEPVAYLTVGIPDWKSYNLFSGDVNLFQSGQYTGVSNINIAEKSDTLWFSLGEDVGVNVERKPVKEYNKKSFFKNKTIELHTFDIDIKNNKRNSIQCLVLDQVPVSSDDDIEVKVLEISNAQYTEDDGFLKWENILGTGKSIKYRISYEIKYGKNVDIKNQ